MVAVNSTEKTDGKKDNQPIKTEAWSYRSVNGQKRFGHDKLSDTGSVKTGKAKAYAQQVCDTGGCYADINMDYTAMTSATDNTLNDRKKGKHAFTMLVSSRTHFILSLAFAASFRVLKQTYAHPRGGIIYIHRHT